MHDTVRNMGPSLCCVGGHVRRCCVGLERLDARPFFDHHERVRASRRLKGGTVHGIDHRAVFNATVFGKHRGDVGVKGFEDGRTFASFGGDDRNDMNQGKTPKSRRN